MTTTSTTSACDWCGTPMHRDYLADQRHPGCGDPLQTLAATVPAEALGPCAVCGTTTVRYGDHATATVCPTCQTGDPMTDRRQRQPVRCLWPDCPQLGQWRSYWCPAHHPAAVRQLRAAVDAARRQRIAADNTPPADPYQTASILLGGTTP